MQVNNITEKVNSLLNIPENYHLSGIKKVKYDDLPIYWLRYTKNKSNDYLGGEHFSVTYDLTQNRIMGFIYMDEMLSTDNLTSQAKAQAIAEQFLIQQMPAYLDDIEIRWIAPTLKKPVDISHDEPFTLGSGTIITGMRVKMWNKVSKKYLWVMIGKDNTIINFEQEIGWDAVKKCRTTEKWLHDKWLQQNDHTLPTIPSIE